MAHRKTRIPKTKAAQSKFGTVIGEFKKGSLRSGSGGKVIDIQQAKAIAASEAKKRKKK